MPTRDQRAGNAATVKPHNCVVAEGGQDRGRPASRRLLAAVTPTEFNPVGQEQDRGGVLPDWLEPTGLGARVEERYAVAVLRELGDPIADLVAIKGRIEIDAPKPIAIETVARPIYVRTRPRTRIRGTWVKVEPPERVEDPLRGDMILRPPDRALMAAETQSAPP
jgi:hypothetical protein